jgi:hypothetical protein
MVNPAAACSDKGCPFFATHSGPCPSLPQARGYALLNLRTADTEGGLLGRTLLTLVSNKGFGAAGPPPPLPAHKFSPHDVVALRPNAGGGQGGPPLAQGLVYR